MGLLEHSQVVLRRMLSLRGVTSQNVVLQGHVVHCYHVKGRGLQTPLVLVHGLASSANAFARVLHQLSRHFQNVWAVDLPGNGFSPMPSTGPLGLFEQLEVLRAFLELQVREPSFLVGNSLGGAMSLELSHTFPHLVSGLGLVAPAGAKVSPERIEQLHQTLDVQNLAQALSLTRRLFHSTPWTFLAFAPELQRLYQSPAPRKLLEDARQLQKLHVAEEVLAQLSMPTLLLWGKSEKLLPYEGIHYFRAHLPPHAVVEEVEGFGHVPQIERPKELAERLVVFARDKLC